VTGKPATLVANFFATCSSLAVVRRGTDGLLFGADGYCVLSTMPLMKGLMGFGVVLAELGEVRIVLLRSGAAGAMDCGGDCDLGSDFTLFFAAAEKVSRLAEVRPKAGSYKTNLLFACAAGDMI
jgi:hypothetical protein